MQLVDPCRGRQRGRGMRHSPGRSRGPSLSPAPMPPTGVPPVVPQTQNNVFDAIEREQEAVVNRLQREISVLKEGAAAGGRSRSSSVSSNTSARSTSTSRGIGDRRASELDAIYQLRRENEVLRKQLAKLTSLLAERETELQAFRTGKK